MAATLGWRMAGRRPKHATRNASAEVGREEYLRVMCDALVRLHALYRDFATPEERAEDDRLTAAAEAASGDEKHALDEAIELLYRTVQTRCEVAHALERDDHELANGLRVAHEVWVRRMKATRAALDESGLHHATMSVNGVLVTVLVRTPEVQDIRGRMPVFERVLRSQLKSLKARVRWVTWHMVDPLSNHAEDDRID